MQIMGAPPKYPAMEQFAQFKKKKKGTAIQSDNRPSLSNKDSYHLGSATHSTSSSFSWTWI
jgi:hypothetical protein